ncbi:MAG: glycosyltransferase family 39 protein [Desulfobacterales bacterium]|nr:glycosyltransferase family 39 protein [Desulfobacterales bacterium]MDD4072957.1 glycosyltransferase family 39 protein [Desulfobacterales bacterium]MDD4392770.1 glycosyltransferase family 39 protein [Desulfobacterales bacterium]
MNFQSFLYQEHTAVSYKTKDICLFAAILIGGMMLRFWGLGNVGLHGDEETMAMPTMQILKSGQPILPSGLFYPRGLGQLYLMALSVMGFGESEWAFRFPSAVVGTLGVVVAFFLGRRFLPPKWNLLFVLVIALYPSMIIISQTARMYIFVSTFLMLFAILIFRWEVRKTWKSLVAAVIAMLVSIQFHQLAIFCSFLFFFPFLKRPSAKSLIQGAAGFSVTAGAFMLFRRWVNLQYGISYVQTLSLPSGGLFHASGLSHGLTSSGFIMLLCIIVVAVTAMRHQSKSRAFLLANALLAGAVVVCWLGQYFAGSILFTCASILYLRDSKLKSFLWVVCILPPLLGLMFGIQFHELARAADGASGTARILKILAGTPSPLVLITFFSELPLASLLYIAVLACAMVQVAKGASLPDHFLLFVLSVGMPLLGIGFFKNRIPNRYLFQLLPFIILCCISGVAWLLQIEALRRPLYGSRYSLGLLFSVLLLMFINPVELSKSINPGYDRFPDHKGAAEYIRGLDRHPEDVIMAEDVLQQTFYLGKVDYWLRSLDDAGFFVKDIDGVLLDNYTHTPLIGSGAELKNILEHENRGAVYIVGSGETATYKNYYLGNGIIDVMSRYPYEIVYQGRDHKTMIWRYSPPGKSATCSVLNISE